jgi:Type IV leader peptidase family
VSADTVFVAVGLALCANMLADYILHTDFGGVFRPTTRTRKLKRVIRWVTVIVSILLCMGVFRIGTVGLVAIASFAVTAATDFESRRLPPDLYLYGSTVLCIALAGQSGWMHAIFSQAFFFALMTATVVLLGATAGGDIKAMMHYGAAAGALPIALLGYVAGVGAAGILSALIWWLLTRQTLRRVPLAALAWFGLLTSFAIGG